MKQTRVRLIKGKYQARIVVGSQRLCRTFGSKELACIWIRQMEHNSDLAKLGFEHSESTMLVGLAGEMYLDDVKLRLAENTYDSYRSRWHRWIEPYFGKLRLRDVRPGAVEDFISERLAGGASADAVNHDRVVLSSFFSWAIRKDLVEKSPMRRVKKLRYSPSRERRALSDEERDQVVAVLEPPSRLAFVFAVYTGARATEMCRVTWDDVDLTQRVIMIRSLGKAHTKTYKSRPIPIHPILLELLEAAPRRGRHVIPGNRGAPHKRDFRGIIDEAIEKAGVASFRWHDLRHTFATNLRRAGVPLEDVATLLGHSSLTSTLIYAHADPQKLHQAVARLT